MQIELELLAPARNKSIGIAAINCGADAVYIAGPSFGAREAAGNPISDIRELAEYAHKYSAKVYAVVNTIIYDDELKAAQKLLWELYNAGVDAFIVQDLGIFRIERPPLPLFASTQTNIRTPQQAKFLSSLGFKRLILERQLSLAQIKEIRRSTNCDLEFFIHGAICVSYSGQCYLSQRLASRSANRGACIQACRSDYDLVDSKGKVLVRNRPLLSLKDLNLSAHIPALIEAGITSFKIEGRLKNTSYVKNVVKEYRLIIDEYISSNPHYCKASAGDIIGGFVPDMEATFNRGYTSCFIDGKRDLWASSDGAKSMGEYLGEIESVKGNWITISTYKELKNGDGLAVVSPPGEITGFRADVCEDNRVRIKEASALNKGMKVYRNLNTAFEKELENNMPKRLIGATINYSSKAGVSTFEAVSCRDKATFTFEDNNPQAEKPKQALKTLSRQLSKSSGQYIFALGNVDFDIIRFYPTSVLNGVRRHLAETLEEAVLRRMEGSRRMPTDNMVTRAAAKSPEEHLSYLANCSNHLSKELYLKCGVKSVDPAYEIEAPEGVQVMRTKYCIKYELGLCHKHPDGRKNAATFREPLYLANRNYKLRLEFDCKSCEMIVNL
jgi:collagenase-like PrtC family protease